MLNSLLLRIFRTTGFIILIIPILNACLDNSADELITVVTQDSSLSSAITASSKTITAIHLFTPTATLNPGQRATLPIAGLDESGRFVELLGPVLWRSLDTTIVSVDDAGVMTAVAVGSTKVEANWGDHSDTVDVTVSAATPVDLILSKEMIEIDECQSGDITASVLRSDGSLEPLSAAADWSIAGLSGGRLKTLGNTAIISATDAGSGTVTLTSADLSKSASVVIHDTLQSLSLRSDTGPPLTDTLYQGDHLILNAYAQYTDNTEHEISRIAQWNMFQSIPETPAASLTQIASGRFNLEAIAPGSVTININCGGLSINQIFNIEPIPTVVALQIMDGAQIELMKGDSLNLVAYSIYSDGHTEILDSDFTWSLLDNDDQAFVLDLTPGDKPDEKDIITLSTDPTVQFERTATLQLIHADLSTSTQLIVNRGIENLLTGIALILIDELGNEYQLLENQPRTLEIGSSITVAVDAQYTSGVVRLPSADILWTNSEPTIATVNGDGLITAIAQGSASVSAHLGGYDVTLPIEVSSSN